MLNILRRLGRKSTSVEDSLRFYIGVSEGLLSLGLFGFIFTQKLQLEEYFGPGGATVGKAVDRDFWNQFPIFWQEQWLFIVFALFVFLWFLLYKIAVRSEMEILVSLYSRINPPHDWEETLGRKWIPVLSIGLTVAFLLLAWFIDNLQIFCIILLFLNIQDAFGNNMLRKNLLRHFLDPKFKPHKSDLHAPFINDRREVAMEYWVWRPQLERIGFMMIGVIVVFLSVESDVLGFTVPEMVSYFGIIAIIIANEYTMSIWRIDRDRKLEAIDERQEEHERQMIEPAAEQP